MVEQHNHKFEWRKATAQAPYHFVDSGLPNVFLVGIRYRKCECGQSSAEIPALKNLMVVIGRAIVKKPASLNGPEIRFLRKRLGKKSAVFGRIIGVTQEQVSRWENDKNSPEESADKLIRVFYCILSGDAALRRELDENLEAWLATVPGTDHVSALTARLHDNQWTAEPQLTTC